jgi:protein O-GlcNAc transferase
MSPKSIADLFNRAHDCRSRGDYAKAIPNLLEIIRREPANAQAHNNLGLLYYENGDAARAGKCFAKALTLKSDLFEANFGLGMVREEAGDLSGAKESYCEALRLRPDAADAHFRLGTIMREWDLLDRAAACFRNSLRFRPGHVLSLINLGETLQAAGKIDESEVLFRKAIAIEPNNSIAWSNLFISMNYDLGFTPQKIFDAHCKWGSAVTGRLPLHARFTNNADPERRLRIGYVSSDFCRHPAASFLEPVLRFRDCGRFELFCYSQGAVKDEKTEKFRGYADQWREIRTVDDGEAERTIRADAVDILVDCTGHMAHNRLLLFARKCAPVQVSWIGYPNTTGLAAVDYRFTDAIVDPPGGPRLFTEELVRLKNGFCCFTPSESAPAIASLPAQANGFVTFGSLHNPARLNGEVVALWAAVLKVIPLSRLLIFRTTLDEEIIVRLTGEFGAEGIDSKRIDFLRVVPAEGHAALYHRVDIALDTFPWSGHTTACEALWMGVPVVTLRGDRHAGRMVASVLSTIGLGDCIASDKKEYVAICQKMAGNLNGLGDLRKGLRERMKASPLCDGESFARIVENEYRIMWKKWCSGKEFKKL